MTDLDFHKRVNKLIQEIEDEIITEAEALEELEGNLKLTTRWARCQD